MATIKLSEGKVVLKDGKVSCECCQDCCLYPYPYEYTAESADVYPDSDLPATIVYRTSLDNGYDPGVLVTLTKIRAGTYSGAGPSGHTHELYAQTTPYTAWVNEEEAAVVLGSCLITGLDPDPGLFGFSTEDTFNASYFVGSTELVRISLCKWRGDARTLLYNNITYQWSLDGVVKTAPQSSPSGTYGGETVS